MTALARIRWRCRRGMRELDLLLERLITDHLHTLSPEEISILEHLLEQADQDILAWLTGRLTPPDERIARLVGKLGGAGHASPPPGISPR